MGSAIGQRVARVTEIDAALEWGFRLDLDEISAGDFEALKLLRSEKARYQQFKQQEQQDKAADEQSRLQNRSGR